MKLFNFGVPKELGYDFHLRDDRSIVVRRLPIVDGNLVEYDSAHNGKAAHISPYKVQKAFEGYKNLPRGMYTFTYSRDGLLDDHNVLKESEKPHKGGDYKQDYISSRAEAKCHKHEKEKGNILADKQTIFMGIVIVILGLVMGLKVIIA